MRMRVGGAVPVRSLRARVTAVAVAVVAVALVVTGVAVEVVLSTQLRRDQDTRLDDRLAQAVLLARTPTTAADLVAALDGRGVTAVVVDAEGRTLAGSARRGPPGRPGGDGPHGSERQDRRPDGAPEHAENRPVDRTWVRGQGDLVRTLALPGDTRLFLGADPDENEGVLGRLRTVLLVVGGIGLATVALALVGGVGVALRPLSAMAALARDIAAGQRGRRLHPPRTDTEIGRTAAAFDAMLDALEAAQASAEEAATAARGSEARTRRFLSDAAHELRTPLTGVQTLAETLVRHPDDDLERRERIATTMVRETRRAGALVADMLELARIEGDPTLDRRPTDLVELVVAESERQSLVAPGTRLRVDADDRVVARADPARVTQILANLLDNARRHSPPEGSIVVTVSYDAQRRAQVVVTDEGAGIPPADRERIFDRLVRLDEARGRDAGGAGLGLAIARALARAHGGDLVAESPVGPASGARLCLTLPGAGTP